MKKAKKMFMKRIAKSTNKCNVCGRPGKPRKSNWFGSLEPCVLCDKCYGET